VKLNNKYSLPQIWISMVGRYEPNTMFAVLWSYLHINLISCLDHTYELSKDSKYRFAPFVSLVNVAQTRDLIHVCKWPKKTLAWHFLHTYLVSMLLCTKSGILPFLLCLYMWCKTSFDLRADMAKVKETWHLLHICCPCKHRRIKAVFTVFTLLCLYMWCKHVWCHLIYMQILPM